MFRHEEAQGVVARFLVELHVIAVLLQHEHGREVRDAEFLDKRLVVGRALDFPDEQLASKLRG
jgi:hypothetical protein